MIKNILKFIYTILVRLFFFNDLDKIKSKTWQSSKRAEKYDKSVNQFINYSIFNNITKFFFLDNIKEGDYVLDVGSGTGRLTEIIKTKTKNCFGLDISHEMLKKNNFLKNLTVGSVFNLPFKNNFFNVVTSMDLMVHFKNYDKILEEKIRVTKKGGLIIFNIGSKEFYEFSQKLFKKKFDPVYDINLNNFSKPYYCAVTNAEIEKLGHKLGFYLKKSIPYNFFLSNNFFANTIITKNKKINFYNDLGNLYNKSEILNHIIKIENEISKKGDTCLTFYKFIILEKY